MITYYTQPNTSIPSTVLKAAANLGITPRLVSDNAGNPSNLYLATNQVGIGGSPDSGNILHVFGKFMDSFSGNTIKYYIDISGTRIVAGSDTVHDVDFVYNKVPTARITASTFRTVNANLQTDNDLIFSGSGPQMTNTGATNKYMRINNWIGWSIAPLAAPTFADASAIFDFQGTTKGVLFPRLTTAQKNAIATPAAGLVVFDTTLTKLCCYDGAIWQNCW